MKKPLIVLMLLALSLLPQAPAGDLFQPLRGGDRNPLLGLFYIPRAESPWLLENGAAQLEFNLGYSNIFEVTNSADWRQDIDLEQLNATLHLRRGFSSRLEAGVTVETAGRWSGFLDAFIQSYHNALGLPNDSREQFDNNRYRFEFGPQDGPLLLDERDQGFSVGAPELFARWSLVQSVNTAAALKVSWKPGFGKLDSGQDDLAVELSLGQKRKRETWYAHLAYVHLGRPPGWDAVLEDHAIFASVGAAFPWRRYTLQVQLDSFDGYVDNTGLDTQDPIGMDLVVGFSGKQGPWLWQIGFAEDLTGDGPAVDFTLDIHLTRRF